MIRRDIPKITDPDFRMSMLATMDHENAVDFIGKKALEHDLEWTEAAMEAGAFDPSGDVFAVTGTLRPDISNSNAMLDALLCLTQGTGTTQGDMDPVYGKLNQATTLLDLTTTDEFRNAYAGVVDRWVDDVQKLEKSLNSPPTVQSQQVFSRVFSSFDHTAMKLMVGAVALDTPDVLETLAKAFPDALQMSIAPSKMVGRAMDSTIDSVDIHLTPYGFALQYARVDCMAVIEQALPETGPTVAHVYGPIVQPLGDAKRHSVITPPGYPSVSALNAAQLHDVMTPLCYPSVYADAMRLCFERDPELDKAWIVQPAVDALGLDPELKRYQMWPAYLDLGIYELDVANAFELAVVHGHVPIVKSFQGKVPWAEMDTDADSSILIRVLEAQAQNHTQRHHHEAVELMVRRAKADGELDRVLRVVAQHDVKNRNGNGITDAAGPVFVAPVWTLIALEHQEVLHEVLKHSGLKPNEPPVPGAWTMLQMAEGCSDAMTAFLRSYSARDRAHQLIVDIEQSTENLNTP